MKNIKSRSQFSQFSELTDEEIIKRLNRFMHIFDEQKDIVPKERPKVLITLGGTMEYIDEVRVISNISTGNFGKEIASHFIDAGWDVTIIHGKNVDIRCLSKESLGVYAPKLICITTARDLNVAVCEELSSSMKDDDQYDCIIHSAAVSDYTFCNSQGKLSSRNCEAFVDNLKTRIVPTPKIIDSINRYIDKNKTMLVGFKLSGADNDIDALQDALRILKKTNLVVLNTVKDVKISNKKVSLVRQKLDGDIDIRSFDDKNEFVSARTSVAEKLVDFAKAWVIDMKYS